MPMWVSLPTTGRALSVAGACGGYSNVITPLQRPKKQGKSRFPQVSRAGTRCLARCAQCPALVHEVNQDVVAEVLVRGEEGSAAVHLRHRLDEPGQVRGGVEHEHVDPDTVKNLFEDRIGALGLDDEYTYKQTGSADALWAAIDSAEAAGEGIIIFNWTPNFTDSDGFYFIEFPPYFYGCRETEGGDGACGSPRGWLKKAANYKFPKTHPAAYTAYTKLDFSTGQIGQMAALVDIDKMSHEDAAAKWLADNEAVWTAFTK